MKSLEFVDFVKVQIGFLRRFGNSFSKYTRERGESSRRFFYERAHFAIAFFQAAAIVDEFHLSAAFHAT